jgi:type II secretory pathway predicted ATPase ExeA
MYHAFYHLRTDPFRLTPDPAFCFRHQRYARALAYMQYALQQGEGFIMVTGLPCTGKTTLIEQFHSELNGARTLVAKLTSTQLQADELLRLICLSLGVGIEAQDKAGVLHQLRQFLVEQANKGRRTLLLIDEAQDLPVQALEELRLLGNLQLNARPLLQIFLVGQEQLLDMVRVPAMRPLYQRLVAACHLEPLSLEETRAYIDHRLERAGWEGEPAFDERSYRMIHRCTEGFPRQINKVCGRLLLYGSTEKKCRLDCFDCLKVLKHWLAELPGSTSESSFQACVDMLNAAWNDAEGDAAVQAAATAALLRGGQQEPPPGNAQAADGPDAVPAPAARGDEAAARAQSGAEYQSESTPPDQTSAPVVDPRATSAQDGASPVSAAGQPETPAGDTPAGPAEASPARDTAADAAVDLRSAVPVRGVPLTTTPRPPAGRKPRLPTGFAPLQGRVFGRAGAPLALIAVLLAGLLLMSGEEREKEAAELAAAQDAPALTGGTLVVAELAPALPSSSDSETLPEPVKPDSGVDRNSVASAAEPTDTASAQDALEPTQPVDQSAAPAGDSMPAAPDDHDAQLQSERGEDQDAVDDGGAASTLELAAVQDQLPADGDPGDHSPAQGTDIAAAAAADSGSVAMTRPPQQAAAPIERQESAAQAAPSADSGMLAAVEVVTVSSPAQAQTGEAAEAVAQPEAQQPSARQQHIDTLMVKAERALWEDRLTVPQGNSAYHYYRQVLKIAPQHGGARSGMQRIAARYTGLIERALANDEIDKARRYVARGLMVNPGNRELLALRQDVETRETWLEAQAVAEAEALRAQPPPAEPEQPKTFLDKVKDLFSNPVPVDMP